ncbi:MAG TPA: NF038122 family metalloprotease [Stellaceae bacterium]|nr:NF038122 family metalloprotease [Stellaceae bacterium]
MAASIRVLAAALAVALAWSRPAAALVITPDYSALSGNPQAAQLESSFNAIIAQYEALFTNAITVTVAIQTGPGGFLGQNSTFFQDITYSQFHTALQTAGTGGNAIAATAAATLPGGSTAPIDSTSTVQISLPNARALGFSGSGFNPPSGQSDGTITISTSQPIQYVRVDGQIASDQVNATLGTSSNYDLISTFEHELDEVLGLGSALSGGGSLPNHIRPEDLFRYDQNGARSFTLSSSAMAFISLNGTSDLVQLNQDPGGDFGDFYSTPSASAPCLPSVQVAFACPGHVMQVSGNSDEVQLLAALGYDPRFSTAATNTTWAVNCALGTISGSGVQTFSQTGFPEPGSSGTPDALGALLGTPTQKGTVSPAPAPGDVIAITGTCMQDVTVTTSNLVIANREGPGGMIDDLAVDGNDVIQGQLEIAGAQNVVVTGLTLGQRNGFSFAAASDAAVVSIHDGATVAVMHSDVWKSPKIGALVQRQSKATFFDDRFCFNGFGAHAPGISVMTNSRATLGADDGSLAVLVQASGGDGVTASNGSSLVVNAARLIQNGNRQLSLLSASSAHLSGSSLTVDVTICDTGAIVENTGAVVDMASCKSQQGAPCGTAIEAAGSSALKLENGASVSSIDASGSSASAIVLIGGSALLAQGASIKSPSGPATIDASENSIIALAGGNTICSGVCTGSTTGTAIQIDHVATFIQAVPATFGYTAAADAIYGGGSVMLQSTVDIGLGTIGVSGPPSLVWTTGGTGVAVAQNSSFRLNGGVTITGALKLSQGSNGFFTMANGGSNSVVGTVTCPFTNIPAAHVAGQTFVTPNVAISTGFFSTAPNTCMPF